MSGLIGSIFGGLIDTIVARLPGTDNAVVPPATAPETTTNVVELQQQVTNVVQNNSGTEDIPSSLVVSTPTVQDNVAPVVEANDNIVPNTTGAGGGSAVVVEGTSNPKIPKKADPEDVKSKFVIRFPLFLFPGVPLLPLNYTSSVTTTSTTTTTSSSSSSSSSSVSNAAGAGAGPEAAPKNAPSNVKPGENFHPTLKPLQLSEDVRDWAGVVSLMREDVETYPALKILFPSRRVKVLHVIAAVLHLVATTGDVDTVRALLEFFRQTMPTTYRGGDFTFQDLLKVVYGKHNVSNAYLPSWIVSPAIADDFPSLGDSSYGLLHQGTAFNAWRLYIAGDTDETAVACLSEPSSALALLQLASLPHLAAGFGNVDILRALDADNHAVGSSPFWNTSAWIPLQVDGGGQSGYNLKDLQMREQALKRSKEAAANQRAAAAGGSALGAGAGAIQDAPAAIAAAVGDFLHQHTPASGVTDIRRHVSGPLGSFIFPGVEPMPSSRIRQKFMEAAVASGKDANGGLLTFIKDPPASLQGAVLSAYKAQQQLLWSLPPRSSVAPIELTSNIEDAIETRRLDMEAAIRKAVLDVDAAKAAAEKAPTDVTWSGAMQVAQAALEMMRQSHEAYTPNQMPAAVYSLWKSFSDTLAGTAFATAIRHKQYNSVVFFISHPSVHGLGMSPNAVASGPALSSSCFTPVLPFVPYAGETHLYEAIRAGDIRILKLLLNYDIQMEISQDSVSTAVGEDAEFSGLPDDQSMVQWRAERTADPLCGFVVTTMTTAQRDLLEQRLESATTHADGYALGPKLSPLHVAIMTQQPKVATVLVTIIREGSMQRERYGEDTTCPHLNAKTRDGKYRTPMQLIADLVGRNGSSPRINAIRKLIGGNTMDILSCAGRLELEAMQLRKRSTTLTHNESKRVEAYEAVARVLREMDTTLKYGLNSAKQQVVDLAQSVLGELHPDTVGMEGGAASMPFEDRLAKYRKEAYLSIVLTGPPGTGKTSIAEYIARVYVALGLVDRGSDGSAMVRSLANAFVAEFEGQALNKTLDHIKANRNRVIFLDEAQNFKNAGEKYTKYATQGLNNQLESPDPSVDSNRLVLIVAGYGKGDGDIVDGKPAPDIISGFFALDPGLESRFRPDRIRIDPYIPDDLAYVVINHSALRGNLSLHFPSGSHADIAKIIHKYKSKFKGNARSVQTVVRDVVTRHTAWQSDSNNKWRRMLKDASTSEMDRALASEKYVTIRLDTLVWALSPPDSPMPTSLARDIQSSLLSDTPGSYTDEPFNIDSTPAPLDEIPIPEPKPIQPTTAPGPIEEEEEKIQFQQKIQGLSEAAEKRENEIQANNLKAIEEANKINQEKIDEVNAEAEAAGKKLEKANKLAEENKKKAEEASTQAATVAEKLKLANEAQEAQNKVLADLREAQTQLITASAAQAKQLADLQIARDEANARAIALQTQLSDITTSRNHVEERTRTLNRTLEATTTALAGANTRAATLEQEKSNLERISSTATQEALAENARLSEELASARREAHDDALEERARTQEAVAAAKQQAAAETQQAMQAQLTAAKKETRAVTAVLFKVILMPAVAIGLAVLCMGLPALLVALGQLSVMNLALIAVSALALLAWFVYKYGFRALLEILLHLLWWILKNLGPFGYIIASYIFATWWPNLVGSFKIFVDVCLLCWYARDIFGILRNALGTEIMEMVQTLKGFVGGGSSLKTFLTDIAKKCGVQSDVSNADVDTITGALQATAATATTPAATKPATTNNAGKQQAKPKTL